MDNGAREDLLSHYEVGYACGKEDEAKRILTLIELDILIPEDVKQRIKSVVTNVETY